MKIKIEHNLPISLSLDPDHKAKFGTTEEEIEFPDELIPKTIAVIDELLDRTTDDLENRSWNKVIFPLVPFPFFQKYRDPDRMGIDDYWIGTWLVSSLQNIITERTKIIELLNEAKTVWIEKNPVVNIVAGDFSGEAFHLELERNELIELRKKFSEQEDLKFKTRASPLVTGSPVTTPIENNEKDWIRIESLSFNLISGDFTLGKVTGFLAPETQEFKVFSKLICDPNLQEQDIVLLGEMYPNKVDFQKYERMKLNEVIRNIKKKLKILPEKNRENADIFIRLRGWKGYKIVLASPNVIP